MRTSGSFWDGSALRGVGFGLALGVLAALAASGLSHAQSRVGQERAGELRLRFSEDPLPKSVGKQDFGIQLWPQSRLDPVFGMSRAPQAVDLALWSFTLDAKKRALTQTAGFEHRVSADMACLFPEDPKQSAWAGARASSLAERIAAFSAGAAGETYIVRFASAIGPQSDDGAYAFAPLKERPLAVRLGASAACAATSFGAKAAYVAFDQPDLIRELRPADPEAFAMQIAVADQPVLTIEAAIEARSISITQDGALLNGRLVGLRVMDPLGKRALFAWGRQAVDAARKERAASEAAALAEQKVRIAAAAERMGRYGADRITRIGLAFHDPFGADAPYRPHPSLAAAWAELGRPSRPGYFLFQAGFSAGGVTKAAWPNPLEVRAAAGKDALKPGAWYVVYGHAAPVSSLDRGLGELKPARIEAQWAYLCAKPACAEGDDPKEVLALMQGASRTRNFARNASSGRAEAASGFSQKTRNTTKVASDQGGAPS